MACDRFVRFKKEVPSHDDVDRILTNYFGGCGTITEDKPNWWMIVLPGTPTSPFDGIDGGRPFTAPGPNHSRWLEVVLEGRSIDVLTRHQDEFTNGIADQLASLCAVLRGQARHGLRSNQ